jgi:hypothetical protein
MVSGGGRGAWCAEQGCLNHVDANLGFGEYNRCDRCRGYYCQTHLVYLANSERSLCLDCLEAEVQERIAS